MRQRLLVSVAGELTNRLLECFEEDSRGKKHIAVHYSHMHTQRTHSPHLCVGFLFLGLYLAAASDRPLCHTQLCHTQSLSHTHNFVTHNLCHTHTTLSHTIFPTHLCHTQFFTLDKNWIITVIRRELNPITCNWTRINERFKLGFSA